jgi:hypothetical protein
MKSNAMLPASAPTPPRPPFDPLPQFARLLDEFPKLIRAADVLDGLPREHDVNVVRLAIIGYSFHCNTGTWTDRDAQVVKDCRSAMPSTAISPAWISFACLITGYLIAVRRSGTASDMEAMLAESLLPGFMIRYRGRLEGLYMATQIKPASVAPSSSVTTHTPATHRRAALRTSQTPG